MNNFYKQLRKPESETYVLSKNFCNSKLFNSGLQKSCGRRYIALLQRKAQFTLNFCLLNLKKVSFLLKDPILYCMYCMQSYSQSFSVSC